MSVSQHALLARPYAEALYAHAQLTDQVDVYEQWLLAASAVFDDDAVRDRINDPSIDTEVWIDCVKAATQTAVSTEFEQFLQLCGQEGRLLALPMVYQQYQEKWRQDRQTVEATVVSAYALTAVQKQALEEALVKRYNKTVVLKERVDSDVLGGAIIRVGDQIFDGSVEGRLAQLRQALGVQ